MPIKSDPFGRTELTGEDAATFLRQVEEGPTPEQARIIAEAIERGRDLRQRVKRDIPPADYSDEISDEQLDAARKAIGNMFDDWTVVDGPAW